MNLLKLLVAAALLALPLSMSACGKKVKPEYPEGTTFPNTYPRR